jgi:transketolase
VLNVGIREQLMTGVAGGLALTGMRPIVHSYASFALDRAYEQIKLDLGHQDVGAVVVTIGASYDGSAEGYTHQSPGDVALLDTLECWTVHVPGHSDEVGPLLREAARHDERVYIRLTVQENKSPLIGGPKLQVIKRGGPLVVAVGPMLDPVLEATQDMDVTVAYTNTPRPLDAEGLRLLTENEVIMVEPYLAGTSAWQVSEALEGVPHRALHLGVGHHEIRRYGSWQDHARAHGLDAIGLRPKIRKFLGEA